MGTIRIILTFVTVGPRSQDELEAHLDPRSEQVITPTFLLTFPPVYDLLSSSARLQRSYASDSNGG